MASRCRCELKLLVASVYGLLTCCVLGLGIWITVVRIQGGDTDFSFEILCFYSTKGEGEDEEEFEEAVPPTSIPVKLCKNGGEWKNGRCVCPDDWKGLRCTIVNFCEGGTIDKFTFGKIPVGRYGSSLEKCGEDTPNAGKPMATALCKREENGNIALQNVTVGKCNETLKNLETQIVNISANSDTISRDAQILTYNSSSLTAENISSAANVVGQILNPSRNATPEAKETAVTTVSQLLDAEEKVFQKAAADDNENTFTTLIQQMETYSLSLNNGSVVQPNVAVQSVTFSPESSEGPIDVRFSVKKGSGSSLLSGSTFIETDVNDLNPDAQTELQVLLQSTSRNSNTCGFVVYQNSKLFQSKKFTAQSTFSQRIVSSKASENDMDTNATVQMVFNPEYNTSQYQLKSYACVFWNFKQNDWDTFGCNKGQRIRISGTDGFLRCHCNHTTNFAILMSFKKNYKYPESLDKLSMAGCCLSIIGLVVTIIFRIAIRKGRKTSVTWVLVSLCTSMLIFNLLFVFGIENSNKSLKPTDDDSSESLMTGNEVPSQEISEPPSNPTCTAIAALLHYFLLVTFMWNGISAAQLYFLLIRTMKPLPPHFILYISLIGWGVPAVVVAMTIGIIYAQHNTYWVSKYRQEEICWLATSENDLKNSPLLWSFIIPVTIILISNVVIFIIITVKVLWKDNNKLTSTKKVSSIKKILSTLSVGVIFGITWILAYFMLIDDDNTRLILSYFFCLFNTTQGVQIFILYTVRTKIFQNQFSKALQSFSSSSKSLRPPSFTKPRLHVRMYNMLKSFPSLNERFKLLEPSGDFEETTVTGSFSESTSN
ncbi:adhesion G-protein coupled receptor G7 [Sorex fumeus]|uniref:adhesion G-protein coupled receptor G7 n=1 Tax=Sorex fumeus TaxID=62283 RepID=UPI0024AC88A8|nr:adhesion G-protein coupled receptor G7 [Sorex fumeus]